MSKFPVYYNFHFINSILFKWLQKKLIKDIFNNNSIITIILLKRNNIIIILLLLFVCYASLGIFAFYYLLTSTLKKESLHRKYLQFMQYLFIDQNSSNSSQKCPHKFFFLQFFLKSSNLIFFFFFFKYNCIFFIWLGIFFWKYFTLLAKKI